MAPAVDDFPTPPLPDATAKICCTFGIPTLSTGRAVLVAYPHHCVPAGDGACLLALGAAEAALSNNAKALWWTVISYRSPIDGRSVTDGGGLCSIYAS